MTPRKGVPDTKHLFETLLLSGPIAYRAIRKKASRILLVPVMVRLLPLSSLMALKNILTRIFHAPGAFIGKALKAEAVDIYCKGGFSKVIIITSTAVMAGLGFSMALLLAVASVLFHVREDPVLTALKEALPGLNCGACGFAGCEGAAKAMKEGKTSVYACVCSGQDVALRLAELLGRDESAREPSTVQPGCIDGSRGSTRYHYMGIRDCRAEALLYGGRLECGSGCLGHGTCIGSCLFGALSQSPTGSITVDQKRCRSCRRCIRVCPKGVLAVTGETSRLIRLDLTTDCLPPCRQKCPAQIPIPAFIRHVIKRDYESALLTLKERNPLILSVSRVCHHPCETICRRNIADQGIAVSRLERFIGEWEMSLGKHIPLPKAPDTHRSIAVVGSGPAGLSCAYFLRRLGHHPVIFEKRGRLGGMLRYGLPGYRLPNTVVDWEIKGILDLGIQVETGASLGRDFDIQDLNDQGFEAIFLGLGAWVVPPLCVPGESLRGVTGSLDFLARAGTWIPSLEGIPVAVIGESNTAMDCARTCIRLRAASVTVICPCDLKQMTARKRDVERAVEEGVILKFNTVPVRIHPDKNGRAHYLEYRNDNGENMGMNETVMLRAGRVIAAYERKPDIDHLKNAAIPPLPFRSSKKGTLATDTDTLLAVAPNIFAAGDLSTGRATVIQAVADGRRAARSIHLLLTEGKITLPGDMHRRLNPGSIIKDVTVSCSLPKVTVPETPVQERIRSLTRDIVGTISEEQALEEAARCLRCGTTCYDT